MEYKSIEKYRFGGVNSQSNSLRSSSIELYRIVVMLGIVAHHYVVNSGLMQVIAESNPLAANSLFLLLFGCWGKIGINCFVLITGYFMCKSNITLKRFLKLFFEVLFYQYVIGVIFMATGYRTFSIRSVIKLLIPFQSLTDGFTYCYLAFYLFIPFLNVLVHNMSEKQHRMLIILGLGIFSVWASIPSITVGSSYVFWFMNLYFVASYIRLYPIPLFDNVKFWGWMSLAALACSWLSVIAMGWIKERIGIDLGCYFFLADSNKITALAVAISFFMFFKNIKIDYNPWINRIASSTFGVFLIHTRGDTMRQWLWKDVCNNVGFFDSPYLVVHAVGVVLAVFTACTIIDQVRIKFVEKPFFAYYDKKIVPRITK